MQMPEGGRVIAGSAGRIRLEGSPGGTRPLTDRVKESLFASLDSAGALEGPFLDLFAGSGAAGIEALSRGAPSATFVERDEGAARIIDVNLRRTNLRDSLHEGGQIVRRDVVRFLRDERPRGDRFAAIFLDPPYGDPVLGQALQLLGGTIDIWLQADGIVVVKHFWRDEPPETIGGITRTRQKRFGETMLSYYTRAG